MSARAPRTGRRRRPDEVSAGGVLARPAGRGWEYALVRAGRHWGLPKGRVEDGETVVQAALREISEECGIPVDSLAVVTDLSPSEYLYRREGRLVVKLVHQFAVTTPEATPLVPQAGEIDEAAWLTLDAALETASFADTRTALNAAAARLGRP